MYLRNYEKCHPIAKRHREREHEPREQNVRRVRRSSRDCACRGVAALVLPLRRPTHERVVGITPPLVSPPLPPPPSPPPPPPTSRRHRHLVYHDRECLHWSSLVVWFTLTGSSRTTFVILRFRSCSLSLSLAFSTLSSPRFPSKASSYSG